MRQPWDDEIGRTAPVRAKFLALMKQLGGGQQETHEPVASTSAAAASSTEPILGESPKLHSFYTHPEEVFELLGFTRGKKKKFAAARTEYLRRLKEAGDDKDARLRREALRTDSVV